MPYELVVKGVSDNVIAYACTKCRRPFFPIATGPSDGSFARALEGSKKSAEECCPTKCRDCGEPWDERRTVQPCSSCLHKRWAEEHEERMVKLESEAKRITLDEYQHEFVYWDGHGSMDGYFPEVGELMDYCEENDLDPPEFVWACSPVGLVLDAQGLIESAFENHHEDAIDDVSSEMFVRLEKYLKLWAKKVGTTSWHVDYSTLVLLDSSGED